MKSYTEILKEYLQGKRNISKKIYKFMNTVYRAVQKERITWEYIINIIEK